MVLVALAILASPLHAQRRRGGGAPSGDPEQFNVAYDARFTFVRIRYTPLVEFGGFGRDLPWSHDYPRAERHLTRILSELTAIAPNTRESNILAADNPELFKYPVAYVSEPGFWTMTDREADNLRRYLAKGGFLIFDDFAGEQWYNFAEKMRQLLPDARIVQLDASHPIFHSFYDIETLDNFVHPYRSLPSLFYGVFEDNDPTKRLLAIVNYNNDIGESWEYSDTGFIPIDITNNAYRLGINYIMYAMTH
jgi:hypothetical protein